MKKLRLASIALAAALLPSITSCSSDPNPFDKVINDDQQETAMIKLNLSVAGTRADEETPAEDALATDAEKKISKVNIYVFNEKHELETTIPTAVGTGETSVTAEVSLGLKTIYVVTANAVNNHPVRTSYSVFEGTPFVSTLDKLKTTNDGFVMFGKSNEQMVTMSASQEDMPSSNVFPITLTRLVAKTQVKAAGLSGSNFGFSLGEVKYRVCQTNDRMLLVHNGSDIHVFNDANNNGTCDGYTIGNEANNVFSNAVTTDFTAENCVYMPENIVSVPKSGNTTFLSIQIATTPTKYYSFAASDEAPKGMEEIPTAGTTYYVVGMANRQLGVSDYAVDGASKHVMAFKDEADAQRYATKLNNGEASSITVSQTESQMRTPATREAENATPEFEVFTYTNGYAYYRVNITHSEKSGDSTVKKNKVVRNNFYKVTINTVKNLGFSDEALLRPGNAGAALDAHGSCWISASFTIAPWGEEFQSVDLE